MKKLKMFCLTMRDEDLKLIKSFGYIPVGLGKNIISKEFLRDNSKINISGKNPFYGEYTFHYWLWKNYLNELDDGWIGFCQYRKFWTNQITTKNSVNYKDFKNHLKTQVSNEDEKFDSIIGNPININQFKLSKFLKKNIFKVIKNPSFLYDKNKRSIKFHFDLMHGDGNLDKAINLLDSSEKKDFSEFVNNDTSFNPHNMFICNSKKILIRYYSSVFPWLERCESQFGFNLRGYGLKRIYGFLAERYMSFWFKKYTNYKTQNIIFKDLSDFKNIKEL